jgi:glucosamine kinase
MLVGIYLGIDGGGSKTSCLIGDETAVLGTGRAGPSNVVRVGEAQARDSLRTAIRQACAAAKIDSTEITAACIGLAGAARPEIGEFVRKEISALIACELRVVGDTVIALEAAFGDGPGVIVIAGTGSVAYGRSREGRISRAGGWGFAISDEGSGQWIGRAAVAAAIGAWDENPAQDVRLIGILKNLWHVETAEQLVPAANATPPPDFSALFPSVLSSASSGDQIARDVLTQAGVHLANLADTVLGRLFDDSLDVPVAMSGGVFASSEIVRDVFYNSLRARHPGVVVNQDVIDPVRGALELARRSTGRAI